MPVNQETASVAEDIINQLFMNMWHDTKIEPTSAGVSHSAPAEVEVTISKITSPE